jgi:hypothetical protein
MDPFVVRAIARKVAKDVDGVVFDPTAQLLFARTYQIFCLIHKSPQQNLGEPRRFG